MEGLEAPDFGTNCGEMTGEGIRGLVGEAGVSERLSRVKEEEEQDKLLA